MADLSFMKQDWKMVSQGKVRSVYVPVEDNYRQPIIALVASDGVSAFDQKLGINIPDKGKILTKISAEWFRFFEGKYSTAFLTAEDDELPQFFQQQEDFKGRTTIMKKLWMLPIEAVMRGYITGSMWKAYQNGEREICGEEITDGLKNCEKLPYPLFTPTTKAPEGQHDENIDFSQMVDTIKGTSLTKEPVAVAQSIRDMSLGLFCDGSRYALSRGVILADTKFEFGFDASSRLCIGDELFTPDSSRFWDADRYEPGRDQDSMDKQIIRNYLAAEKAAGRDVGAIPKDILMKTKAAYENCFKRLFL